MGSIEDDLARLASRALGQWHLPDQVPKLLKYRENAVFAVTLADENKAALRLHRPGYHSRAALNSELTWMANLRRAGILVPEPIPLDDGGFVIAIDDAGGLAHYADLISWVDGVPLGESGRPLGRPEAELRAIFGAIGREMARMHLAADRFAPPSDFERPSWNAEGLLGEQPFWGRFWDCDGLESADRVFLTTLRGELRDRLATVGATLDQGLIHADLVRENVMLCEGGVAFIDFDDCGFGFRLFDLATTLLRNRREPHYPAIREALLAGYISIRPELAAEHIHLPLFLLLRSLTYIGWAASRPELPDNWERLTRYVGDVRDLAGRL